MNVPCHFYRNCSSRSWDNRGNNIWPNERKNEITDGRTYSVRDGQPRNILPSPTLSGSESIKILRDSNSHQGLLFCCNCRLNYFWYIQHQLHKCHITSCTRCWAFDVILHDVDRYTLLLLLLLCWRSTTTTTMYNKSRLLMRRYRTRLIQIQRSSERCNVEHRLESVLQPALVERGLGRGLSTDLKAALANE